MNIKQKIYDSKDSGNTLIKIKNSSVLSKNLEKIRHRKPLFTEIPKFQKKKSNMNLADYYRKKENSIINKIIGEIKHKEIRPILYTEQNELINSSMESRKRHNKLNNLALKKENANFALRLLNQKPFISAKSLDKEYKDRLYKNTTKKNANKSLVLPPIYSYK